MSCNIVYGQNNKIAKVLDTNGQESLLFKKIAKIPHIKNLEKALEIYKQSITPTVFYNIIGEEGAKNVIKIKNKLEEAKKLLNKGVALNEIEKKTGWYLENEDWKYLDREALKNIKLIKNKIEYGKEYRLSEIIDNKNLFQMYPEAKDIIFTFQEEKEGENLSRALYYEYGNLQFITFNKKLSDNNTKRDGQQSSGEINVDYSKIMLSSIIHELQHFVQRREGFPSGGNIFTFHTKIEEKLGIESSNINKKNLEKINKASTDLKYNEEDRKSFKEAFEIYNALLEGNKYPAYEKYKKIFGEVEARLAQSVFKYELNSGFNKLLDIFKDKNYSSVKDAFLKAENIKEEEQWISFKSDKNNSFNSFKEALKDSDGGDINVNINGRELISISSNTNKNTPGGLINYLIKNDLLSDEKIIQNGDSYLKADGYDQIKQVINELLIKGEMSNIKIHKDGRLEVIEKEEYKPESEEQQILDKVNEIVSNVQNTPFGQPKAILTDKALKDRLFNLLEKIGIKTTTFEEYVRKFNIKNGIEPSAEALADIANQVIAFREGTLDIGSLTEETAHFIVEGWEESEISDLMKNIHKTATYQQFGQQYREIYRNENRNLTEQEIDNLVRKEILGKELAKGIINRFQNDGSSNLFVQLYERLINFFNKIVLRDNYKEQFEDILDKIEDLLISQDVNKYIDTTQYRTKKFKLYNVTPSTATSAQRNLIKSLMEQERALRESGRGSASTLQKLENMLNDAVAKKSVQDLVVLAKRQTNYIKEAVRTASKKNSTLSLEENMVFHNLTNVIRPALSQLKASLRGDTTYKTEINEIDNVTKQIIDSEGMLKISENSVLDNIVDRLMKRNNFEDGIIKIKDANGEIVDMNIREHLLEAIKTAKKDTSAVYSYFGQITHAQDPLLNILGSVIGDMTVNAEQSYMKRAKEYQKKLRELGFREEDLSQLVQEDGYIISKWDFAEYEEFKRFSKAFAYRNNLQTIVNNLQKTNPTSKELAEHESFLKMTEKEFLESFESIPVISDEKLLNKVKTEAQSLINKGSETVLSEDYLNEQEKLYKDLNISEVTKIKLKGFSEIRGQIKKNTIKSKNGVSIYTLQNKYDLEFLNVERRKASSIFNEEGMLKKGIIQSEQPIDNNSLEISKGVWISLTNNPSEEAQIAFEMNKLTQHFVKEKNKSGEKFNDKLDRNTHSKWYADLQDMENDSEVTREDIITWFNLNTQIGFSKEFFENNEKIDLFSEFENDEKIKNNIKNYKELTQKRRALVNQYRDPNNGVNTLAEAMTPDIKKEILRLSESINIEASGIFMYIKGKTNREDISEKRAETQANEAYFGALADNNLTSFEEIYDFTLEHLTTLDKRKVQQYKQALEDGVIPSNLSQIVDKYGTDQDSVLRYAQTKLAPYYSSYAPLDLQNFYDKIRNSQEKISSLVEDLNNSPDVRISVSYDYLDNKDSSILNNNRDKDFKGGYQQPSLLKTPEVFGKLFNFNNKDWSKIGNNPKLKTLHELQVDFQYETLKSYGVQGYNNVYLAPQISKSRIEKLSNIIEGKNKKATVNEWVQELTKFRTDELVQGEEVDGKSLYNSGIRVIPKYYLNKLENTTDVSTDLFYSSMMMAQQAELYKSRKEKYSELASIQDAFLSRQYPEGKASEATNTYKMAKSQLDYALFGVQESARLRVNLPIVGQKDLTKLVSTVRRWKQNLSLALNPIVPLTSMFTAQTQLLIEKLVGQYIDSDSYNKGIREFRKIASDGINESLEILSSSKVSILGEYFGIYDLDNRFKDSKYNKYVKTLGKSMYGLHTAGNFVPLTQGMLSVLYGNRVYDGRIVDYGQYKTLKIGENKTIKEIENSWTTEKSIYDYIEVKDGKVVYDGSLYKDLKINSQEEFRNLELGLISKSKKIVERIDGQIKPEERTALQRHFLLSFMSTHKGWLMIATANRFKGQHINLQTGQLEEGTYVSAGRYFKNVVENFAKLDIKALKTAYEQASPLEKQNLMRIVKELGVMSAIYVIGMLLVGFADDEEEETLGVQASAYLMDRLINETVSAQTGVFGELYNTIKEPVVGLQQVTNAMKIHELATGDKVITRGRYAGLTERERYVLRTVVGAKVAFDLSSAKNLKSQRQSYEFFSKDNEAYNPIAYLLSREDFKEE